VHVYDNVYREMLVQICRDYPGLPDPRTLRAHEIRFFYEPLRAELIEHSKPKKK
jgi:hypothetical protein